MHANRRTEINPIGLCVVGDELIPVEGHEGLNDSKSEARDRDKERQAFDLHRGRSHQQLQCMTTDPCQYKQMHSIHVNIHEQTPSNSES